jgi:hypothetical protein
MTIDPVFDDMSDMSQAAEAKPAPDGGVERAAGILFVGSRAVNSIEISINELMVIEPLLFPPPVEFLDAEGNVEPQNASEIQITRERARISACRQMVSDGAKISANYKSRFTQSCSATRA